jgi:hypothetical protein
VTFDVATGALEMSKKRPTPTPIIPLVALSTVEDPAETNRNFLSLTRKTSTRQQPSTRVSFSCLLLSRVSRLLATQCVHFFVEFAPTVHDLSEFLKRFPSAGDYYETQKTTQRKAPFLSMLGSVHTEDFSMCFDFEKAEIHLESDDAPVALWNEFHMRRTRLGLAPDAIVDELSRELVEHFLAPSKKGPVVSSKLSSERWSKLLLLHWIHGCDGMDDYIDGGLKSASKEFFAGRLSKLVEAEKRRLEEERRRAREIEEREKLRIRLEQQRIEEEEKRKEEEETERRREEARVEEDAREEAKEEENSMVSTGRSNFSKDSPRGEQEYGSKISDIVKGNKTNGWASLEDDENGEGKTEEYVEEEEGEEEKEGDGGKKNVLGIATPRN